LVEVSLLQDLGVYEKACWRRVEMAKRGVQAISPEGDLLLVIERETNMFSTNATITKRIEITE